MDELADQRLARGEVAVGLDPHAALRLPAAGGDGLLHAGEQLGIELFHPGVMLRCRGAEDVSGIALDEVELSGEGTGGLAHRLALRPQPGGVDVGVTDGAHRDVAGVRGLGHHRGQFTPGGGVVRLIAGQHLAALAQGTQDAHLAHAALGQGLIEVEQHFHVPAQCPHAGVDRCQAQVLDESVVGAEASGVLIPRKIGGWRDATQVVGGAFQPQFDRFATAAGREQPGMRT